MVKDQQVRRLVKLKKNEKTLTMAAAKAGLSRKTARKYLKSGKLPSQCQPERYWRTRSDPFESVWPEVEEILKRSPTVEGTAVFESFVPSAGRGLPARPVENAAAQDQAVEGRIRRSEGGDVPAEVSSRDIKPNRTLRLWDAWE